MERDGLMIPLHAKKSLCSVECIDPMPRDIVPSVGTVGVLEGCLVVLSDGE